MAYERRGGGMRPGLVLGLVGGLFLAVGLVFLGVGWWGLGQARAFQERGVNVEGRVEKKWESERDCRDDDSGTTRRCTDFNVGYGYEMGGQAYHGSSTTDFATWAGLEEGAVILLRVLPEAPETAATDFRRDSVDASGGMGVLGWIFGGLGGVFALIGGGMLGYLVRRARGTAWMRAHGVTRGAVVLAQEETSVTVNDRRMWRISWKDDLGGTGQSRGRAREDLPEVGARITVLVDPAGQRAALWEGDA